MVNLGIVIFDDVELLDFCGPYEVFSSANRVSAEARYTVFTVAEKSPVRSNNGLEVIPHYLLDEAPGIDYLLVPGGRGTRREQDNSVLIDWLSTRAARAERVLSVCTGVFLLVKAGLTEGLTLTTHGSAFDELAEIAPDNELDRGARFLDHGRIAVSAGISAGIDLAFAAVAKHAGEAIAEAAARYMEYDWKPGSPR